MADALRNVFTSILILAASAGWAEAASSMLVSVQTPRGAKQAFILIRPDKPVAAVILLAGGHGALGLQTASQSDPCEAMSQHGFLGIESAAVDKIASFVKANSK